ncbi:ankyrin repeat domain-containing protein 26-like [Mobula hypostoma]|uniref:ankyrin repeat domain-containing protein 26-like n=1 Tax=Mobula hypostoma TaxID=723540 RepID=UPI002FC39D81
MKRILQIAKRKEKPSFKTCDTSSEIRVGYELKEKDLGKLHKAASAGDLNRLRQLIKKKDVNQLDKQNRAPLHLACANGHADVVALLVENKSNPNICDNENRSPLMKAVQCEQERCVVILLSHDADPNLVDINGYTALHLAVLIPNITLVTHLLEYGAHIDARDKNGYTPLLLAATRNHQKMAKCLLKKGADVNAKDKTGKTTLMIAARNGQITLVKLLLHCGTDASLKDDNGRTADDYALTNRQHACSHLITEHHTKKKHRSSRFKSGAMKEMPSRSDHSAEVNLGFGEPAMNKEMIGDISLTESFSGESKSAVNSWLSSDEEDNVPCSSKTIQKFNLTNLLNSSQRNKENSTEEATSGKTHLMDNLQPVKSDKVRVEKLEDDHQDEEETFESSGSLVQSRNCSPVTVGCSFSFPVENHLNSTPSKDNKEGMFLEEEEAQPLKACSKRSELEAMQPFDFSETSAFQEQKTSCKINRRDLLLELGLEESEVEADTESLKDSESISEGSGDESIASSGILGQRNIKMNQNEDAVDDSDWDSESSSVKTPKMNRQTASRGETSPTEDGGNENRKNYEGKAEVIVAKENMQQLNVMHTEQLLPDFVTGMHKVTPAEPILNKGKTGSPLSEGNNLGSNEEEYENQHNQERPIKQDHLSFMNVLPAFEDSSASEISRDEEKKNLGSNEEEYENQHNQERPIKEDHLSSEISRDEEKNNLGSNEEEYENQHNQERPIKQDHLSVMNVLSAFEDSSASEISVDEEKARKASSNEMNRKAMNISDDLSNLTQLFDSSESDSESSDLMHTIKAQLFQIDVETIDSVSLLKIENMVQEYERELKRKRKDYALLAKQVKCLANERKELGQILMEAGDKKLTLEYKIMEKDLEVKYYNFRMKQEKEKRITAEMLLEKSCENLQRKESQYCEEIQAKHKSEQMLRNLEIERDTVMINLKKLSEENKELQIQLNQEKAKCEEILNRHLHNQQKIVEENNTTVQEIEPLAQCDNHHNEEALMEHNCTLQQEVTVLKRELKYLCEHHQEEREKYMEQIETLKVELEDTKKDLRSSENNLTQTNLQYNSQLNAMKSEVLLLTSKLELLETQRKDQQNEKESILSRLNATIQELECSQKANCEFRQILQRERDEWVHLDEKRNNEISNLRAISKKMSHKLTKEERKANDLDKKLHHAKLSLAEKNCMLESVQKELRQFQEHVTDLEKTNKVEKGQLSKHEVCLVSLQERLAQAHSEITLLRQQLEDAQNKVIMKEKVVTDVQDKFSNILATLQKDSEQRISLLEKRNEELLNKNMEQSEQKSKYENEIDVKEASFRQLQQDLADSLKKLSMSEASLEVVTRSRNEIECEKNHLQKQLHRLKIKLEENKDKNVQSKREIQQLENALKEKEYEIAASQKIQEALSTSSQRNEAKKHLEDQIQRLEIENAELKAAAKEQTNKAELLEKEIKESQSVHARLEDLITNLQGLKVNLEDQLSQEQQNAKDSHQQLEEELKSRSKLALRHAQLEKVKKELSDQVELEKKRVKKLVKINQSVRTRLKQEIRTNSELQRELYRMRTLLKTTKKKLKQNEVRLIDSHINGNEEPDNEQNETADTVSTLKRKIHELSHQLEGESAKCKHLKSTNEEQIKAMHFLQKSHDHLEQKKQQLEEEILHLKTQAETQSSYLKSYKKKMKKEARKEVIQKMEEVNTFLKIHQVSSETLEEIKASNELSSRYELEQKNRDLEWELNKFRTSQQETLKLKGPAEKEIQRNKELHSLQPKPCESIAAQLNGSNERLAEGTTELLKEHFCSKSLIGDSFRIESLTTWAQNGSHLQSRLGNGSGLRISHRDIGSNLNREEDELLPSRKVETYLSEMRDELRKGINKELAQAYADLDDVCSHISPMGSTSSSLTKSNQIQDPLTTSIAQYRKVLKDNHQI